MNDAIGAMRARVMLQSPTRVADEIGGAVLSWADEGAVWAEIVAGGAGEIAAHDRTRGRATYRVTINRYADVRAGWRVLWGDRSLRVTGVVDDGAARMGLNCEEEAA